MQDFFEQEENFDVLFLGSSHVLNAISPMDLWNDYGIVSYNLSNHAERLVGTYYNMLLALQETNPKMVVVDTFLSYENTKTHKKKEYTHSLLDGYPISYTKYLAIRDLFEGDNLLEREIEFLFPFSMYHARWDELVENDFRLQSKYEKGAESRINVAVPNEIIPIDSVEIYSGEETINMLYLRRIIEYCKSNNIEILITNLPYPADEEKIAISKYVQKIANEYEVNYINFLNMNNIVNHDTDYFDKEGHLNPSGARKITDYLGKYIKENYNIPDQKDNGAYSFWYNDYEEYIINKIYNLKANEKKLNNYLMLLYREKDIKYEIKISSKKKIEEGSVLQKLLANLENNYQIDDNVFEGHKDKTIKITTWHNKTGKKLYDVWF